MSISSFEIRYKPSVIYGEGHYDVLKTPMIMYTASAENKSCEVLIPSPVFIDQLIRTKQLKKYRDTMLGLDYVELDDLNEICTGLFNKYNEYIKLSVQNGLLNTINKKLDKVIENQCIDEPTNYTDDESSETNQGITDYESLAREVWEEYDEIQFFMNTIIGYVRYGFFVAQLMTSGKSFHTIGADDIRLYFITKEIEGTL